jgi:hypothetical protein
VDDKHVSRHVRFGTVSQIDDASLPPDTPQDRSSFASSPEPMTAGASGLGSAGGGGASTSGQGRVEAQRRGSFDDRGMPSQLILLCDADDVCISR